MYDSVSVDFPSPLSPFLPPSSLSVPKYTAALQDGTALCKLMERILPGRITSYHIAPKRQFLAFQNIHAFLRACEVGLGISQDDLFEAESLFHGSDFRMVLHGLSTVSATAACKATGLARFPASRAAAAVSTVTASEDIYGNLESLVAKKSHTARWSQALEVERQQTGSSSIEVVSAMSDAGAEDIYGAVVNSNRRSRRRTSKAVALSGKEEKRRMSELELLETEENYVAVLRTIVVSFGAPLLAAVSGDCGATTAGYERADIDAVLLNTDELLAEHAKFLAELQGGKGVSDALIGFKDTLLLYGSYCAKLPEALRALDGLSSQRAMAKRLGELREASGQRFALKDLLSVPYQRVLKYSLIVKEIIKHTQDETALKALGHAETIMLDVAKHINETKRDVENLELISELQRGLKDFNVGDPGFVDLRELGRYLVDGDVKMRLDIDGKVFKRYIFLFQKGMVVCKQRFATPQYLYTMYTRDYSVVDEYFKGRKVALRLSSFLPLARPFNSIIIFKSEQLRADWNKALARARADITPDVPSRSTGDGHRFTVKTFYDTRHCDHCKRLLWGLINQGFQCKGCANACHRECLPEYGKTVCKSASDDGSEVGGGASTLPRQLLQRSGTVTAAAAAANPAHFRSRSATSSAAVTASIGPAGVSDSVPGNGLANNVVEAAMPSGRAPTAVSAAARATPKPSPSPKAAPAPAKQAVLLEAIHNYVNHSERTVDDLEFQKGDRLVLLEETSPHWWRARDRNGKAGLVPSSFVQRISAPLTRNHTLAGPARRSRSSAPAIIGLGGTTEGSATAANQSNSPLPFRAQRDRRMHGSMSVGTTTTNTSSLVSAGHTRSATMLPKRRRASSSAVLSSAGGASTVMHGLPPPVVEGESAAASPDHWFEPDCKRDEAEERLEGTAAGAFLVRTSVAKPGQYVLSVSVGDAVRHMRINRSSDGGFGLSRTCSFKDITEMVKHYTSTSLGANFPSTDTCLLHAHGTAVFDPATASQIGSSSSSSSSSAAAAATSTTTPTIIEDAGAYETFHNPDQYTRHQRQAEQQEETPLARARRNSKVAKAKAAVTTTSTTATTAPPRDMCRALYDFKAENNDELSLRAGDCICVTAREGCGDGWWRGSVDGRVGLFPAAYVAPL